MKKLASIIVAVGSLAIAAPVFACPHSDEAEKADDNAPRTADKDKAKEQPKAEKAAPAKEADKAKPAKPADKVSSK